MVKILALCLSLAALAVISESKSISPDETSCVECAVENYKRIKRDATNILNSINGLVTNILDTNWRYIDRINARKQAAQRKTIIVGPGQHNDNRVMVNGNDWEIQQQRPRRRNNFYY